MKCKELDAQELMSRRAAAEYLGTTVGVMAVWDSIKRYNLNPQNVDGKIFYSKDDLDKHLNRMFFA